MDNYVSQTRIQNCVKNNVPHYSIFEILNTKLGEHGHIHKWRAPKRGKICRRYFIVHFKSTGTTKNRLELDRISRTTGRIKNELTQKPKTSSVIIPSHQIVPSSYEPRFETSLAGECELFSPQAQLFLTQNRVHPLPEQGSALKKVVLTVEGNIKRQIGKSRPRRLMIVEYLDGRRLASSAHKPDCYSWLNDSILL